MNNFPKNNFAIHYKTFNTNKINIEDEGMEDLEKFNQFYLANISKTSLFEENENITSYVNFPSLFENNNPNSQINLNSLLNSKLNISHESNFNKNDTKLFSIYSYIKRVISSVPKQKLKKLILDLSSISSNDLNILTLVKSVRSNMNKEKLIDKAVDIVMRIMEQ